MLNLLKSTDFINTPHVLATQIYKIYKFTATDDDRKMFCHCCLLLKTPHKITPFNQRLQHYSTRRAKYQTLL